MNAFIEMGLMLDQAASEIERELIDAEMETLRDAETEAHRLSQGQYSTKQLRKMGHPYSRQNPRPPEDEAIINRQSGRFDDAWFTVPTTPAGDMITSTLANNSDKAAYMGGTSRMIERPIVSRVAERIQEARDARIRSVLVRYFR